MYDTVRATSAYSIIYFLAAVIIGNFILLSLFQAILLSNFEDDDLFESLQQEDNMNNASNPYNSHSDRSVLFEEY